MSKCRAFWRGVFLFVREKYYSLFPVYVILHLSKRFEIKRKGGMYVAEERTKCSNCGNEVKVEFETNSSGGTTYVVRCRCGEEIRTVHADKPPKVTGGFAEKEMP